MARKRAETSSRPPLIATRYELLEKVGAGGVANVYRARDTRLNRAVAIKILRDEYASDAEFVERFQREAHIAAGLSHPNVVSVDDYGRHGNTAFLTMDFVDGETLKARLRRVGRLPPHEAVAIARQVLAALGAAHAQGLVHRDVKPHNVLLGWDGTAKLTDFGIALAAAAVGLTQTGTTVGTAAYAAPEQVTGKTVGPPADVYGVGMLLYEMLAGRPPFAGGSVMQLAWAHVNEAPKPPSELVEGVPPELEALILRALAKDPAERFADAAAMLAAVDELATSGVLNGHVARPIPAPAAPAAALAGKDALDATRRFGGDGVPGDAPADLAGDSRPADPAAPRRLLVPAGLAASTTRLRKWVAARPARAMALPALAGILALGGLIGAPRVLGGTAPPTETTAVLAAQATTADAAAPIATPEPTAPSVQLSGSLVLPPLEELLPSPIPSPTPTPAGQSAAPPPPPAADANAAPADASAAPPPEEQATPPADAAAPTATPAPPPPTPTSAPAPPPAPANPPPAQPQPAPSGQAPAPPPATATATPRPAGTAPAKASTPAPTPKTPAPTAPVGSTPAPTPPPASTPAPTSSSGNPTPVPTSPSRPPSDASPTPSSSSGAQPTPAPQPTPTGSG